MQQEIITDLIRDKLTQGATFRFRVISGSMVLLIQVGDEVVAQRVSTADLRCGDIILYAMDGAFRIHRLLARRRQGEMTLSVTKGDAPLPPIHSGRWLHCKELTGRRRPSSGARHEMGPFASQSHHRPISMVGVPGPAFPSPPKIHRDHAHQGNSGALR